MADEKNIGTPAEEEIEIITLTDENGEDMDFEFLDLVEYEGKRYAVLLPPVEDNIINLRLDITHLYYPAKNSFQKGRLKRREIFTELLLYTLTT